MNGKNRRNKRACPNAVGDLREQNKKQHRRDAVEKDVHQVMRARVHAEQLTIEHVRHRCERVPVLGMNMSESPRDPAPRQPCSHVRVVEHVKRIVVINELVIARLTKHRPRQCDQKNANAN